jgi:hypothetical protein
VVRDEAKAVSCMPVAVGEIWASSGEKLPPNEQICLHVMLDSSPLNGYSDQEGGQVLPISEIERALRPLGSQLTNRPILCLMLVD